VSTFYETVGRLVVWAIRQRYRKQLRAAAAVAILAAGIGGYLALTREVKEG
jgi:hypothetical protein